MYKRCISVCLILLLSIQMYGCNPDVENVQSIPINGGEEVPESRVLFGKWRIDKAVLWSEMYTGTIEDGVAKEDLFDPESFIGYELEYSNEVFRLGDKEYEITFEGETNYNDFSFIPIGTEIVLLNENVMLVGLWGEILIAYRIE